jgi:hypothetical protein
MSDRVPNPRPWTDQLSHRERMEVEFARIYVKQFGHGTDGDSRLRLIDRLSVLLDQATRGVPMAPSPDEAPAPMQRNQPPRRPVAPEPGGMITSSEADGG